MKFKRHQQEELIKMRRLRNYVAYLPLESWTLDARGIGKTN